MVLIMFFFFKSKVTRFVVVEIVNFIAFLYFFLNIYRLIYVRGLDDK